MCGVKPESPYEDETPQGEFCRADVTVVNRTNRATQPIESHYVISGRNAYGDLTTAGDGVRS